MELLKITIVRFIFSYITICANYKFSLGLNPNFLFVFVICLFGEIAYMFVVTLFTKSANSKKSEKV